MIYNHILVYNPTKKFKYEISDFVKVKNKWHNEILYELTSNPILNNSIKQKIYDLNFLHTDTHFSLLNINDTSNRYFFDDFYLNSNINEIIDKESPGGDIRKYVQEKQFDFGFNIRFRFAGSYLHDMTSFEPLSIESVRKLHEKNIFKSKNNISFEEIINWKNTIEKEWDLKCGVMGNLSFNKNITGHINGFVIYNVDDDVCEWVKNNWGFKTNRKQKFIKPNKYDLYDMNKIFKINNSGKNKIITLR